MKKLVLVIIYSFWIRWFLKLIVGVQLQRSRILIKEKQFIIVANHNSHLDTMAIMASLPSTIIHKVKPVAAVDHFGNTRWKSRLSNFFINTLLIQRKRDKENPSKDPIARMLDALDSGYSLIIFPEGTRGEPEQEQSLKPGVAMLLSERPHIPYVPVFMKGMGKAMPKGDSLIVPHNSSLTYGLPTKIKENRIATILEQIAGDFKELKEGTYSKNK